MGTTIVIAALVALYTGIRLVMVALSMMELAANRRSSPGRLARAAVLAALWPITLLAVCALAATTASRPASPRRTERDAFPLAPAPRRAGRL